MLQKLRTLVVASQSSCISGFPETGLPELHSFDFPLAACPLIPCIKLPPAQNIKSSFCFLDRSLVVSEIDFFNGSGIEGECRSVARKSISEAERRELQMLFSAHDAILM